ncbi:MAG: tetratricopeptide repeat protein [Nitrosopumilus sp.]|nr:tetratricopeptide repeat protein [Nitrosopumilus sp.]
MYFDRALQIDPALVDSLYLKGEALHSLGNYTGAEYYVSKAFAIDPNNELIKKKMQK